MSNYSTIAELNAFNEAIFSMINEYLKEKELFSENAVLAVKKKTNELNYGESIDFDGGWDVYKLTKLIRTVENNELEPDGDETFELASKYYFVR